MSFDLISSLLLGQADVAPAKNEWAWLWTLLRLVLAVPLPLLLGYWVAQWLRMKDYGWRLALIFFAIAASAVVIWSGKLKPGVDLQGGVILVYEIDRETLQTEDGGELHSSAIDWARLIQAITDRINPSGAKDIVVRPYGEWQIEVIVPEVNKLEVKRIKELISTAGALEFRIVANKRDHEYIIRLADEQSKDQDMGKRRSRYVTDGKKNVGFWARAAREKNSRADPAPFKFPPAGYTIRSAATGELIDLPPTFNFREEHALERYLKQQGISDVDVLMSVDDGYNVTGRELGVVTQGRDETLRPCVHFNMKAAGAGLMAGLTGNARPDGDFYRLLGIMLDGELLSAPRVMSTISDRGQITGSFTVEEVEFLVGILQAGSLPAALKKMPINENQIGAVLGEDTIAKGKTAIWLSLVAVVVFMVFWYRQSGIIASAAVGLNLVLIVSLMMVVNATLTLPGLAGMILTVGMAVDSNVLIFERMREELEKGAALRMAIRNGFSRAASAIIDSNLTTILTALILYAIGTDQLKGFAVTLTLGLSASLFTAVFCAHVAFDILERKRIVQSLKMRHLPVPSFDFVRQCGLWVVISLVVIVAGLVACGLRGSRLFDIDFTGGTSVTMVLQEPTTEKEIRSRLDEKFKGLKIEDSAVQYTVNRFDVQGQTPFTVWKVDSSIPKVADLENTLQEIFNVARYSLNFGTFKETRTELPPAEKPGAAEKGKPQPATGKKPAVEAAVPAKPAAAAPKGPAKPAESTSLPAAPASKPANEKPEPAKDGSARNDLPPDTMLALADDAAPPTAPAKTETPKATPAKTEPPKATPAKTEPPKATPAKTEPPKATPAKTEPPKATPAKTEPPKATPAKTETPKPTPAKTETPKATPAKTETPKPTPAKTEPAAAKETTKSPTNAPAKPAKAPAPKPDARSPDKTTAGTDKQATAEKPAREVIVTEVELTLGQPINGLTLRDEVLEAAKAAGVALVEEQVTLNIHREDPDWNTDWRITDAKGYRRWQLTVAAKQEAVRQTLERLQEQLKQSPVWSSSSEIGAKVAGDARMMAIWALVASWLGIIVYIWVRFQRVIWGVAAVVALVHDVLVTLAAIAFSYWLAPWFGFLLVDEFKIGLSEIAAFLTIIGYSVNDTIVTFDRIREIRGKSPDMTADIINSGVNQTLSRTILTAVTVFLVVLILYVFGGEGIHGFAYAMLVGTIVGCYSTIFIAAPIVLWMLPKSKKAGETRHL